ncbi:hypothetical protein ID866_9254 [Astraeus odoratus]|nr:hypothetical protein ID866_9254 [Astraeus odoratus]
MEDQSAPFSQTRGPIFSRPDGAPRRLAKRVPMVDSVLSPSHAAGISTKSVLRARSASAEPRPAVPSPSRSRSVEPSPRVARATVSGKAKEPAFPRLYTAAGVELPYPLVAKEKSHIGPIPEESEEANVRGTHLHTSVAPATPHKSQLKQPSVTSRIPRIGAKPYARPRPGVTTTSNTASVSKVHPANDSKPLATPQPHRESGHGSSDDLGNQSASVLASPNNSALKTLKRKRTPGVVAVQSNSRPLKIRQVVPGMFGGKYAAKLPQDHAPEPTATPLTSPQKPIMPVPFRKVVDGMLSARYGPSKSSTESGETHATLVPVSIPSEQVTDSTFHSSYSETPDPQHSPMSSPEHEASEPSAQVPAPIIASNEDESDTLQNENKSHSKKSSRARRHTSDASDVVGNTSRSTNTGRRPQSRADGDGFMGMSATALKALTSSNTAKNQQTVAIFATEVIRKEGLRPESPSVKIRTILQKQREEKDRERNERAERRARRSEEGCGDTDTEGENKPFGQTPGDGSHDEHESLIFTRHCRGLGDEEDYETPDGQRQNKLRVEEGEEGEEVKQTKQVKWHRGLSTSAYLDDVHPRSRTRPDTVVTKGCLAPSSKVYFSGLGNLPLPHSDCRASA